MQFKRFNRLTSDEFLLLQGTEKMSAMISNKWFGDADVLSFLDSNAMKQWCAIKHGDGFIIYFESVEDVRSVQHMLNALNEPEDSYAPEILSINIVDEQHR